MGKKIPIEEFIGADISEKEVSVYFRIYNYGQPMMAFHGELLRECVPELTTWSYFDRLKCTHPSVNAYMPGLQLVLTKRSEHQGLWPKVFATRKHASELQEPSPSAEPVQAAENKSTEEEDFPP